MKSIHIQIEEAAASGRVPELLAFIAENGLAHGARAVEIEGAAAETFALPDRFVHLRDDEIAETILGAGFLGSSRAVNQAVLRHSKIPKLFVGTFPMPTTVDHVCVPFEGRRVRAPWLRRVLAEAARLQWRVRLCYCDRTLVPAGIMRLADWLRMDSVKSALVQWLAEDVQDILKDWIDEFPHTEVHSEIGSPRQVLDDEDPARTLIMSSFEAGFHPTFGHRGAYYGGLLIKTGFTGYFIP